jgi:hypothetical protein
MLSKTEFAVIGLELIDEKTMKVTLRGKAEGTIFDNQCYIKLPLNKADAVKIGDKFELCAAE